MPGSGGWITAENVHEYFDAEGNWMGEEEGVSGELGEGAGAVHARGEEEQEGVTNGGGHGEEEGEAKRARRE
jgi:nucleotide-sensitive chloride channel 1A